MMETRAKPVETDEELHLANQLMAGVHADDNPRLHNWLFELGHRYPGFRREHTRIIRLNVEVAAALRIMTATILLGESRLKMGGIGWVTTAPRHRGKGLCRILMNDAVEYMKRHNFHVSMLFGIPDLYQRFDYVTTLADYSVSVDTVAALTFDCPLRLRPAKPGVIPVLQKIHADNSTGIACSMLRTMAYYKNRWDRWRDWYVLTDHQGKIMAYFIAGVEGDHLRVDDAGVADPGLCAAVLGATAQLASDESLSHIRFYVPPPHPLARYLLQFRSTHEMHVERDAGGMMAFINLGETLESLIPEWEGLLAEDLGRDLRTEFTLVVNGGIYRIRSNRGAIDVSTVPGTSKVSLTTGELMHLITGYRHLDDVLAPRRCLVSPDARRLMNVLFPKRYPYLWRFDRF